LTKNDFHVLKVEKQLENVDAAGDEHAEEYYESSKVPNP